jgi:hypothetical protein
MATYDRLGHWPLKPADRLKWLDLRLGLPAGVGRCDFKILPVAFTEMRV